MSFLGREPLLADAPQFHTEFGSARALVRQSMCVRRFSQLRSMKHIF